MSLRLSAACLTIAALLAAPAAAQTASEPPLVQQGNLLLLDTLGHRLAMPLPDWLAPAQRLGGDVVPLVEASYVSDDRQALLELYPEGEGAENWSTLFGARVTLEADRPLADYRNAVIYGYSQGCKPELTGFFQFGDDAGDAVAPLGFVCGAHLDRLEGYAGKGEVMVMAFRKTEAGVAIVYQEWRGPAFDPSDPATWPISRDALEARAGQLQDQADLSLGGADGAAPPPSDG